MQTSTSHSHWQLWRYTRAGPKSSPRTTAWSSVPAPSGANGTVSTVAEVHVFEKVTSLAATWPPYAIDLVSPPQGATGCPCQDAAATSRVAESRRVDSVLCTSGYVGSCCHARRRWPQSFRRGGRARSPASASDYGSRRAGLNATGSACAFPLGADHVTMPTCNSASTTVRLASTEVTGAASTSRSRPQAQSTVAGAIPPGRSTAPLNVSRERMIARYGAGPQVLRRRQRDAHSPRGERGDWIGERGGSLGPHNPLFARSLDSAGGVGSPHGDQRSA